MKNNFAFYLAFCSLGHAFIAQREKRPICPKCRRRERRVATIGQREVHP